MTNHFTCQTITTNAASAQAQKTVMSHSVFLDQRCSRRMFFFFNKPNLTEVNDDKVPLGITAEFLQYILFFFFIKYIFVLPVSAI